MVRYIQDPDSPFLNAIARDEIKRTARRLSNQMERSIEWKTWRVFTSIPLATLRGVQIDGRVVELELLFMLGNMTRSPFRKISLPNQSPK